MKDNNLNVLTYSYSPWRYPSNWCSNLKQFFRNIKYAHQRITQGYCDQDVWNLDSYYSELFYKTLKELANTTHGYPGYGEFADTETESGYDKWVNYLNEMAEHFINTQEWREDTPMNIERDKAWEEMNKYITKWSFEKEHPDDKYSRLVEEYSDEVQYNRARKKWLDKERKSSNFRVSEKDKAFEMMRENFFHLWD